MTTVYRLPEEPPVGTVVRPDPDTGARYVRSGVGWLRRDIRTQGRADWRKLLGWYPEGLAAVEPDPHPTPWTISGERGVFIADANGEHVIEIDDLLPLKRTTAERIVKAVNEAAAAPAGGSRRSE